MSINHLRAYAAISTLVFVDLAACVSDSDEHAVGSEVTPPGPSDAATVPGATELDHGDGSKAERPAACAPGAFVDATLSSDAVHACKPCPEGTFSAESNAPECTPWRVCAPGTYVASEGSPVADRVCGECDSGTFSDEANARSCSTQKVCEAGAYIASDESNGTDRTCLPCPSGSFSEDPNAANCTPWHVCLPGTYVSTPGSAVEDRTCMPCAPGTLSVSANQGVCLDPEACPAGSQQVQPATLSSPAQCASCNAGVHCAGGAAVPAPCTADSWDHDADPATACVPRTACRPGQHVVDEGDAITDRTCAPCQAGTFSSSQNASACLPWSGCGSTSYQASAGTSERDVQCTACPDDQITLPEVPERCVPAGTTPFELAGKRYVALEGKLYALDELASGAPADQAALLPHLDEVTYFGGDGTLEAPREIAYCLQLQALQLHAQRPRRWLSSSTDCSVETPRNMETCQRLREQQPKYFVLSGDVDCSDTSRWDGGAGFNPIRNFYGQLDGAGHAVHGLYIHRANTQGVGLFSALEDTSVRALHLKGVNITGDFQTGGLAGSAMSTYITDVSVVGKVTGGGATGGLIGHFSGESPRRGSRKVALVERCAAAVQVRGLGGVGGLIGSLWNESTLIESYATGDVTSTRGSAGGLVGDVGWSRVESSYARGHVVGGTPLGGLIGSIDSQNLRKGFVERSYATGSVAFSGESSVGVTLGGLAGSLSARMPGIFVSSFWDRETGYPKSREGANEGVGRTTRAMKARAIYHSWDLDTVWRLDPAINDGYPHLRRAPVLP